MIASLRGIVQHIEDGELIIEIGGIGLRVVVPSPATDLLTEIGKPVFLHTYLIVREDALKLYGFKTDEQRNFFKLLIDVSGVGPRLGMSILSHLSPDMIRSAVANNQADVLVVVPGVGRKTAERILFQLRDKLEPATAELYLRSETDTEVLGVLTALGYSLTEAQAAIGSIPPEVQDNVEERVRIALRYFAQG
jgi:Holliday junction DNA helicase RuvA